MLLTILALAVTGDISRDDKQYIALSELNAYASAAGAQYVNEVRCRTGKQDGIRDAVIRHASAYVKPEMLKSYIDRTFDNRVRRITINPNLEPCNYEALEKARMNAATFLARARKAFSEIGM